MTCKITGIDRLTIYSHTRTFFPEENVFSPYLSLYLHEFKVVKKKHLPKSKVFDPHHYVRSGADQKPSTLEDEEKGGRRVILGCAITYRKSKVARM